MAGQARPIYLTVEKLNIYVIIKTTFIDTEVLYGIFCS